MEPGRNRPNENYAEITFAVSDGRMATHAICGNCLGKANDKRVEELFSKIKAHWREEMVGWGTDKQFDRLDRMEFIKGTVATDIYESEAKYKIIAEKERRKRLNDAKKESKKDAD